MNAFLARFGERGDMNQYWYSAHTIDVMVSEIEAHATRAAFLSTPSVYFSLPRASGLVPPTLRAAIARPHDA